MSEARVWVTARLEGDTVKASVVAAAPYAADREAVVTLDVEGSALLAAIRESLKGVLDAYADRAGRAAARAALQAETVAITMGEDIERPRDAGG